MDLFKSVTHQASAATAAQNAIEEEEIVTTATGTIADEAASAALKKQTNATNMATAATAAFNSVAKGLIIGLIATVATYAVTKLADAISNMKSEAEKAADDLKDAQDALSDTQSEVSELEQKIKDLNDQIEKAGASSIDNIVDPDEKARLKEINDLLEKQLALKQQQEQNDKNSVNTGVKNSYNAGTTVKYGSGWFATDKEMSYDDATSFLTGRAETEYQKYIELINQNASDEELQAQEKILNDIGTQLSDLSNDQLELAGTVETTADNYDSVSGIQQGLIQNSESLVNWQTKLTDAVNGTTSAIENTNTGILLDRLQNYDTDDTVQGLVDGLKNITKGSAEATDEIEYLIDTYGELYDKMKNPPDSYGNISNTNRNKIDWTADNMQKYAQFVEENDIPEGSYSTVDARSSSFGEGAHEIEIAYTPLLDTGTELIPLTNGVIDEYINALVDNATDKNGIIDVNKLFKLDSEGLDWDIDGQVVHIQNMVAAAEGYIQNGAAETKADVMAIAGATADEIKEATGETSDYVGMSLHDIQSGFEDFEGGSAAIEKIQALKNAVDPKNNTTLSEFIDLLQQAGILANSTADSTTSLSNTLEALNNKIDKIQSAYGSVTTAIEEYNKYGYMSADSLQALMNLDWQYLSSLELVNGKLQVSKEKYAELIVAQYTEMKTVAIKKAIEELDAIAQGKANEEATKSQAIMEQQKEKINQLRPELQGLTDDLVASGLGFKFLHSYGDASAVDPEAAAGVVTSLETTIKLIDDQIAAAVSSGTALGNELNGFDTSKSSKSAKQLSNDLGSLSGNLETLVNAAKEYNAYGAISVATMNDLYGMSDAYTQCLEKQGDQLVVNTDAFLKVLQAEIAQAKAAEAAGDSDGENAKKAEELSRIYDLVAESAKGTTISIEELTDIVNGFGTSLDDAQEKAKTFQDTISGIKSIGDNIKEANADRENKNGAFTYDDVSSQIDTMQSIKESQPDVYNKIFQNGKLTTDDSALRQAGIDYLNEQKVTANGDANMIALLDEQIANLNNGIISGTDFWLGYNTQLKEAEDTISDANDSIDNFQSAWTDLNDVVDEYNKYGYITQDSYQKLIELDDKYLACLDYQDGQLKLNRDAFIKLYSAELLAKAAEMELKAATLEENGASEESVRVLREAAQAFTSMSNDVATGSVSIEDHLEGAGTSLDNLKTKLSALKSIVSTVFNLIKDNTDDSGDKLKIYGEAVVDEIDDRIDALEDQKQALEDANDEEERAIELAKLQDELARAKSQKTVRLYTGNGYEWSVDESAVSDAEQNLSDQQRDWNKEDAEAAIDEQIDALNDLKDKWQDVIDNIGTSWDDYQAKLEAEADAQGMTLDDMESGVDDFSDSVIANMKAIAADESLDEFADKVETVWGVIENLGTLFDIDPLGWFVGKIKGNNGSSSNIGNSGNSESVGDIVDAATDKQGGWFENVVNNVKTGFQNTVNGINTKISDFKIGTGNWFSNLQTNISTKIEDFKTGTNTWFGSLQTGFSTKIADFKTGVGTWFNNVNNGISNLPTNFAGNFTTLSSDIGTLFNNLTGWLSPAISTISGNIGNIISGGWTLLQGLSGDLGDWLVGGINAGGSILGGLTDGLKSGWGDGFLSNILGGVTDIVGAVVSSGKSSSFWGTVGNLISGAVSLGAAIFLADGTYSVPFSTIANVDEEGQEFIVRKPESGRYTYLETGDGVVPADITERLFKMGGDPSGWFADQYHNYAANNTVPVHSTSNSVAMGNIIIENPVGDSNALANDIIQKLPTKMQQRMSKR